MSLCVGTGSGIHNNIDNLYSRVTLGLQSQSPPLALSAAVINKFSVPNLFSWLVISPGLDYIYL